MTIVWKLFAAVMMVYFLVWLVPANAQIRIVCGPYDSMVGAIAGVQYGESIGGFGIVVPAGWRLELWYSDTDRRSWSILAVQTSGKTCLLTDGVDWEHILPGKQAQPRN